MKYSIAVLMAILCMIVNSLAAGSNDDRVAVPLKQGVFLVATPELEDPNFIHTVILLVSYGKEGALGLVINRPSGIDLKKIFPYIEGIEEGAFPIYLGGPVERANMSMLFTSDALPKGAQKVFDNLYFTYDKAVIVPVLQHRNLDIRVRVYAGVAGWAHGQLEQEIMHGMWTTLKANQETVFTENPFKIWPSIFRIPTEDNLV